MINTPDIEAIFYFNSYKKNKIFQGYRPSHLIKNNYMTTGVHNYYNNKLNTSNELKGTITFISPNVYPSCLWVDKKIDMYEGNKLIGYAIVTKIFNKILELDSNLN